MTDHSDTPRPRGSKSLLTFIADYRAPDAMPKCHRIAHFLDWYARKAPKVPISASFIYRACFAMPRTPKQDSAEAELIRTGMSRAREIMKTQYKRGLISERGLGFRATIDDEDTANTQLRRDARRLVSAHHSLESTHAIVDPAKVKNLELRTWVLKSVNPLLKVLGEGDRIHRLLPKAEDTE